MINVLATHRSPQTATEILMKRFIKSGPLTDQIILQSQRRKKKGFRGEIERKYLGIFLRMPERVKRAVFQVWCPVRTSILPPLADRMSTSALVPCAATLKTCCPCSRSWQDPTLTSERSAALLYI